MILKRLFLAACLTFLPAPPVFSSDDGLSEAYVDKIQSARRLWIQYRDGNCNFRYDPEAGSVTQDFAAYCVMKETVQRANELEHLSGAGKWRASPSK